MAVTKWPLAPLGEVLRQRSDLISVQDDVAYEQVTVRVRGRGLAARGALDGAKIGTKRQYRVSAGQLLVSKIDARHGAFGIVPPQLDGAIVTQDFPTFDIDRSRCLPDYLAAVAGLGAFWDACLAASVGTTNRVRLNIPDFLQIEVPLPSLEEQHLIVRQIQAVDLAVTRQELCISSGYRALAALQARTFDELDADVVRIGDLASVTSGGTPLTSRPQYWNGEIPFIKTGAIAFRDIHRVADSITQAGLDNSSAKILPAGSVLVAMYGRGTVGRSAVLMKPMASNQACAAILPNDRYSERFLFHWLWYRFADLIEMAVGTTNLTNISKAIIEDLEVPLPELGLQRYLAEPLDAFLEAVHADETELGELRVLRQSLLESLIAGDRRVSAKRAA